MLGKFQSRFSRAAKTLARTSCGNSTVNAIHPPLAMEDYAIPRHGQPFRPSLNANQDYSISVCVSKGLHYSNSKF